MKVMLVGAAVAAFTMVCCGAAEASICTNQCDHTYSACNTMNGGNAQQVCMPKWMQCKRACTAPSQVSMSRAPAPPPKH